MTNKEVLLKSLKASRRVMVVLSAILILFGGVILTFMQVVVFPYPSTMEMTGRVTYFFSAVSLIFYFMLEWRNAKSVETGLLNEAGHGVEKIITYESLSDKILKWMITLVGLFFALFSYSIVAVIAYRTYDDTVQPQATYPLPLLAFELAVTGVIVFIVWKKRSARKLKSV